MILPCLSLAMQQHFTAYNLPVFFFSICECDEGSGVC